MYSRACETQLIQELESSKILLLIGARQVGKTSLMKKLESHLRDQGEETVFIYTEQIGIKEKLDAHQDNIWQLVPATTKRLYIFIDEIQYLNDPTRFLKYLYDKYNDKIKLIVSGSSAFYIDEKFHDSLAGRKKIVHIRTLSFREYLHFNRLDHLVPGNGHIVGVYYQELLSHYIQWIVRGGYPDVVLATNPQQKKIVLQELVQSYIKKDIIDASIRDSQTYYKILQLLASQIGKLVNANELANIVGKSRDTIQSYIYTMQKSFHIALIKPFGGTARKELTKMPKVYFEDTGLRNYLANTLLPWGEQDRDSGALLENIYWRQWTDEYEYDDIRFWRTQSQQELDFIIQERSAFEIKTDKKRFNIHKYEGFTKLYPHIPLSCLDLHDAITMALKQQGEHGII